MNRSAQFDRQKIKALHIALHGAMVKGMAASFIDHEIGDWKADRPAGMPECEECAAFFTGVDHFLTKAVGHDWADVLLAEARNEG